MESVRTSINNKVGEVSCSAPCVTVSLFPFWVSASLVKSVLLFPLRVQGEETSGKDADERGGDSSSGRLRAEAGGCQRLILAAWVLIQPQFITSSFRKWFNGLWFIDLFHSGVKLDRFFFFLFITPSEQVQPDLMERERKMLSPSGDSSCTYVPVRYLWTSADLPLARLPTMPWGRH